MHASILPDDDLPLPENIEIRTDYHGTPCAGLALASEGHGQVIGVAPHCSFMSVRWRVRATYWQRTVDIFHYISKRADVVSCSSGRAPIPDGRLPQAVHDTLNELATSGGRRGKGLVICLKPQEKKRRALYYEESGTTMKLYVGYDTAEGY